MTREIRAFTVTIPAGTPQTALAVTPLAIPARVVDALEIIIPPGSNGLMGFQFTSGGQQIIPVNPGGFIIGNAEKILWGLDHQITSGAWQVSGFNTGAYNHSIYVRFLLDTLTGTPADTIPELTTADLSTVIDTSGVDVPAADLGTTTTIQTSPGTAVTLPVTRPIVRPPTFFPVSTLGGG
jgi:hypothetical protein